MARFNEDSIHTIPTRLQKGKELLKLDFLLTRKWRILWRYTLKMAHFKTAKTENESLTGRISKFENKQKISKCVNIRKR